VERSTKNEAQQTRNTSVSLLTIFRRRRRRLCFLVLCNVTEQILSSILHPSLSMNPQVLAIIALLCLSHFATAFIAIGRRPFSFSSAANQRSSASLLSFHASSSSSLESSPNWKPLKKELDSLPVFCVANGKGQPLQYDVGRTPQAFFFCDVDNALAELKTAKQETSMIAEELDIIPFPLGTAFQLYYDQQAAMIVPSRRALTAAGAPPNVNPLGQQVPLFGCMDISMPDEETGRPVLPLFMDASEAQDAVDEALGAAKSDGEGVRKDEFEIVSLSLDKAVELLCASSETAFQFMPPKSSIRYIGEYLSD